MNGIDISSHNAGIDLSKVPCDFVICKATQGTSYVNPEFKRQITQTLDLGKCAGIYHYIGGGNAKGEAQHFYNNIKQYIGRVIPVLDWEPYQNSAWRNEAYLEEMVKEINRLTGVPCMIYSSLSYFPWDVCKRNNGGTWVAQYANNNATGYQDHPWNEGKYSCTIRQYSSEGHLSGWGGRLDLNKAYINAEQWKKFCNPGGNIPTTPSFPTTTPDGSVISLAAAVMRGEYGNGEERKNKLGSKYNEVQSLINRVASSSNDQLAKDVINGMYGNGAEREQILGNKYKEVQKIVNSYYSKKSIDQIAKEVINGDWGNGAARKNKLTAAGYNYDEVQKRVNEMLK